MTLRSFWRGVRRSKTMIFAAVLAALGAVEQSRALLEPYLKEYAGLVFVVIAVVIAILRVVTTQSIVAKGQDS